MSGGWRTDGAIAEALGIGVATVARVRRRCVEEGLEAECSVGGGRLRRSPGGLRVAVVALARGSLGGV